MLITNENKYCNTILAMERKNLFVTPYLEEKAKTDPAYAQFLNDIQALVNYLGDFSAYVIGGEPDKEDSNKQHASS